MPAYVVFTDATLVAIAETVPADLRRLAGVPGVGPAKLDKYGEQVLALLTERLTLSTSPGFAGVLLPVRSRRRPVRRNPR